MHKQQNIKYILYARKSTESEDRQVASIESQVNVMKEKAESLGLNIAKVMSESGSGFKPGRKVFNEMLELIRTGQADGIICWKLSRLSRNPDDAGVIMGMIQRKEIQHIRTTDKDWYPEDNVLMMYVEFGITNQYSKDLSLDARRGLEQKALRGWYPIGSLPLGYSHNHYSNTHEEEIIPGPDFPLIQKAFKFIADREMMPIEAHKWLQEHNVKAKRSKQLISYSTFFKMLSNQFYAGTFVYNKVSYIGKHKPMVGIKEYDAIQKIIHRAEIQRPQVYSFAYTGLMKCGECGGGITAQHKYKHCKNGNVHHYIYYNCTKKRGPCSQRCIEQNELENQWKEILRKINILPEFKDWIIEQLRKDNESVINERDTDKSRVRQQYDQCVKEMEKLVDKFTLDLIPEDIYKKKLSNLQAEKARLELLGREQEQNVDDWVEKVNKILDFATTAQTKFITGNEEVKKHIIFSLGSNLILLDKKVRIDLKKPLELIQNMPNLMRYELASLEPLNSFDRREKIESLSQSQTNWRG